MCQVLAFEEYIQAPLPLREDFGLQVCPRICMEIALCLFYVDTGTLIFGGVYYL